MLLGKTTVTLDTLQVNLVMCTIQIYILLTYSPEYLLTCNHLAMDPSN